MGSPADRGKGGHRGGAPAVSPHCCAEPRGYRTRYIGEYVARATIADRDLALCSSPAPPAVERARHIRSLAILAGSAERHSTIRVFAVGHRPPGLYRVFIC